MHANVLHSKRPILNLLYYLSIPFSSFINQIMFFRINDRGPKSTHCHSIIYKAEEINSLYSLISGVTAGLDFLFYWL